MSGIDHNFANVQNGLDKMQDFKIFKTKWNDFAIVYHMGIQFTSKLSSFSSKSDLQFLRESKFKKDKRIYHTYVVNIHLESIFLYITTCFTWYNLVVKGRFRLLQARRALYNRVFQIFGGHGNQSFLRTTLPPDNGETLRFVKELSFLLWPGLKRWPGLCKWDMVVIVLRLVHL